MIATRLWISRKYFNPRSPCGERLFTVSADGTIKPFQSTLPMRGATRRDHRHHRQKHFNPRSPCGERPVRAIGTVTVTDFNPRSPCGERLPMTSKPTARFNFNPRSPCGERRNRPGGMSTTISISIHAPHAGSDHGTSWWTYYDPYFNPRSPCGERRSRCGPTAGTPYFNPRSPCGERLDWLVIPGITAISIHAPHAGSDDHL